MTAVRYVLGAVSGLVLVGAGFGAATQQPAPVAPRIVEQHTDQACAALHRLGDPRSASLDLQAAGLDDRAADTTVRHVLDHNTCTTH